MNGRRWTRVFLLGLLALFCVAGVAQAQTAPQLISAVSRRLHAGKAYDIPLPPAGGSGIECRNVSDAGGGMTVVLLFDQPVDAGAAAVTAGAAAVSAAPTFSANAMTIQLSGVTNAQELTIAASNVTSSGGPAGSAMVKARILTGDINSNGSVSVSDVNRCKLQSGFAVTGDNFRCDINCNGSISGSDINTVKFFTGTSVAGGATANTAPTISDIVDQAGESGSATLPIAFAIADAESAADQLAVSGSSSNPSLVPTSGISIGGSGANRTLTLTSTAGQVGSATITIAVSDGLAARSDTFNITVTPPTKLFLAYLRPQGGALTQASGSSTLRLAGDELSARLTVNYSNLSSVKTGMHTHGPADPIANTSAPILLDMDEPGPAADGTWTWTFPADATQRQQLVNYIKNGQVYLNVHTTNYPSGEIKGFYVLANGSINFTPPPDPPALPPPTATPTANDAARFFTQATFGPTQEDIDIMQQASFQEWLDVQVYYSPTTLLEPILAQRRAAGQTVGVAQMWETWWNISITAPDQLRQRVAFALSQIFVVSVASTVLAERDDALSSYYDLLLKDCFGNFRTLLEDVTLHPAMGLFLDMRGNKKGDPTRGTNPNENYAREVLQLFSTGLNNLHPDGSLKLDQYGLPIATYDQNVVVGFARVFTGWDWHFDGTTPPNPYLPDYINPMSLIASRHETGVMPGQTYSKLLLSGVTLAPNRTGTQDLKDALDNIFNHPNVGPFICRQLIQRLVTSNPSPGYIYRTARVFDGYRSGDPAGAPSGVRGDLDAVIRAILLDYEARSTTFLNAPGYGKLREPLLRNTAVIRAFHPTSTSGYWKIGDTTNELLQTPLTAPTVFNFFEPNYAESGPIAAAGLVSPEFQITSETTAISTANFMRDGIYLGWKSGSRDIKITLDAEKALAGNPGALLDRLNLLLMSGNMSSGLRTIILNHVNTISASDTLGRAQAAIHLIATSPDFSVQK